MKEENQNRKEREMTEEQIDFRALLFKYIIHWPWFVGAVLLCLVGAWFYLHWATPIYNISATVLIKDEKKGGGAGLSSELEDMGLSGLMTSSKNIDNELEVLRSKTLVKEVVNQLGLYITYKDEDEFPAKSLYKTSPVQVSLTPQEAEKLSSPMVVEMILQPKGSIDVNVTVGEKEYQKHFEKLPAIFPTDEGTLAFFQDVDSVTLQDGTKVPRLEKNVRHITATINKPMRVAKGYCSSLSIAPTSKTTSVAVISLKIPVCSVDRILSTNYWRCIIVIRIMIKTKSPRRLLSLLMNVLVLFQKNWEVQKRIWKPLSVTQVSRT